MDRRNTGRVKKYGVCLNDKCENYKVIQEIVHGEFECPVCHKRLSECAPPKKKSSKKPILIAVAVAVVLAAIAGCLLLFSGNPQEDSTTIATDSIPTADTTNVVATHKADTVVVRDTVVMRDTIVKNNTTTITEKTRTQTTVNTVSPAPAASQPKASISGTKNLGYATFKGNWPNDVNGRMVFNTSHVIDSRDPKGRVAEAGDYVIGEWSDGHLVQGIWYGADNQVKGSVIIGK